LSVYARNARGWFQVETYRVMVLVVLKEIEVYMKYDRIMCALVRADLLRIQTVIYLYMSK
jgi:hypothetical protein